MLHHASLPVADLAAAAHLYDAALGALGDRRVATAPGFAGYGPRYYAAFIIDLDGHQIEAVHNG